MIIQGSPDILQGPTGMMYRSKNTMLSGLSRTPEEIAEINRVYEQIILREQQQAEEIAIANQKIMQFQAEQQELLAKQRQEIEDALEKQRQLNAQLALASNNVAQQALINDQIRTLSETVIQPKLIELGQKTIDYVEQNPGNLTVTEIDNMNMATANNINAVIENQNATNDYIDAVTTYLSSEKTVTDVAKVSESFAIVNETFVDYADAADVIQVVIAEVAQKIVEDAALINLDLTEGIFVEDSVLIDANTGDETKTVVDLTAKTLVTATNNTVATTIVADKKIVSDPVIVATATIVPVTKVEESRRPVRSVVDQVRSVVDPVRSVVDPVFVAAEIETQPKTNIAPILLAVAAAYLIGA
jgi:hypothetical protein